MTVYASMAYVYDRLMGHVDYEGWATGLEAAWNRLGQRPERILDLGTGTGSVLIPLARRGYHVSGIDNAPEMLAVCQDKLFEADLAADLFEMDIRQVRLTEPQDAAICLCDTLNYLAEEKELSRAFKSIARSLKPGGSFIFDLRTLHYFQDVLGENQWVEDEGDVVLIWNNDFSAPPVMDIGLTFFVRQKNGLYQRFEEEHRETLYPVERIEALLTEAGFRLLWTGADFSGTLLDPQKDERVYFAAVKD